MSYNQVYIPGGADKVSQFSSFFYDAYRTWSSFYAQAYRDVRSYAGDNWTQQEKTMLQRQRRMILELNKIRRIINLYSGYERENRTSTVVFPVENSDQETADQLSEVMMNVYAKTQAEYIFSEAFEHSLKSGLAMVGMYMDFSRDKVNGDLKFYWRPFNSMILDPYFTNRDLSDCDQAAARHLLGRDNVKALLPWVDPSVIDQIPTGIRDNKYQYLGIYRQYNSTYIAKNLLTYDQFWKRTTRQEKFLIDQETGESKEWNGDKEEEHELQLLLEENPRFKLINAPKNTVELNIIVGGQLLYEGPDPTGIDNFPFVPILAYHEPLIDTYELKIQGLVRSIRDAQRQYNRRHSQIIDIMESIINTGWIHKNGAVVDPDMLFQSGQGRNIVLNNDSDVNTDIREINPPQVPQGYLAYQDVMDKNIMEIPGGSEELLGLSSTGDSQVSGRLAEVRSSNGLKGNRGLFDNFEYAQKLFGNLVLEAIQKNFTPGKVERIIQKQPTQEFFDQSFQEYDCVIKSIAKTQTQKEAYYFQLLQLRSIGVPIPDDELIAAVPLQNKTDLLKKMQEIEEQKKQAAQIEMEDKNRQNRLEESKIEENIALAQERRARVLSDIGLHRERISEAEQNYSKALLDNVRTIAEIQDLKDNRVTESIRLLHELTAPENIEEEHKLQSDKLFMQTLQAQAEQPEQEPQQSPSPLQGMGQQI